MKRIRLFLGLCAFLIPVAIWGSIPHLVNVQGVLRDAGGNLVRNQTVNVDFKTYNVSSGGSSLWSETQSVPTNNEGAFNVLVGSATGGGIPDWVFSAPDRWLGIAVGGGSEVTPRLQLVSTGYSYRVGTVDGATGGSISGSLSFGNAATPLLYIYESGTANSERPVFSHSPALPNWGLSYRDVDDWMVFQRAGIPIMTVDLGLGKVRIGPAPPTGTFFSVSSGGQKSAEFLNDRSSGGGVGVGAATLTAQNDNSSGIALFAQSNTTDATVVVTNTDPNGLVLKCFGQGFTEAFKVSASGTATTKVLEITGGADLSEQFEVAPAEGRLEPGMVVAIDADNPSKLVISNRAYDCRVAGIISGAGGVNTGMIMGQAGSKADGKYPIALTGRVYCWADASNGAIQPGDLLTTSDTPGHAMKVLNCQKAQGAILGKAMTELKSGRGLVLVLVTLQ